MLVSDFVVNLTLKKTHKSISMEHMECLIEEAQKKKYDTFCTCAGRNNKIATSAKLLNITYNSYGFTADLIEAIN